ncbi:MAG: ABC transporter ATP-binding protein [Sphingobacteriales bacterium]|nr:MAG: ABC transporter ATP-binding protein [Sphingobacteriales bacterium]
MKLLYSYLSRYWKLMLLALGLAAINQIFSLLDPLIFRHIVDDYGTKYKDYTKAEYIKGVLTLLGAAIGVAMVSRIAKNFQDYYMNVITQRLGAKIYQDGLTHSLDLPYQTFEDQSSGQTLGILQKVRTDSERLIGAMVSIVFTSLVGIVFVTIIALRVHWAVAVVFFSAIPLVGILSWTLGGKIKKMQKTIVSETTALAGATTESLRNIELIKSLGLSKQEEKRLNATTDKILQLELKKVKYIRSLNFVQGTMINFMRTCILFLMFYLIYQGAITVGDLFMLMIYSFFIFGPLQELGSIINIYREAEVSLNNFSNILDMQKERRPQNPENLPTIQSLVFNGVSFQHKTAPTKALENITFGVKQGETVAFVGPSGSGKTTLVKLLVGLYQPQEGHILYNEIPENAIDLDQLRNRIGFVTQDTQLFSGTIRENLLFVNPTATEEQCYDVLNKAACHNLLARADKGLDTVIGEGGVKVSGGEKQRLSIARALLRNPDLLVFDEATSALDSLTEEEITNTIREISKSAEQITILIAHRLSTIMHADRIFVLERGRIIEQGKHMELLELKGLYYAMWRQQIGENRPSASAQVTAKPSPVLN